MSPDNMLESAGIFRQLLVGAKQFGGKSLMLQAATRLCRLDMMIGKAEESGRQLEEIYESFTEGFDTLDLREAKAVLDEWRILVGR
jgi:adenylate cyclase